MLTKITISFKTANVKAFRPALKVFHKKQLHDGHAAVRVTGSVRKCFKFL
jgi:hypothetical protein